MKPQDTQMAPPQTLNVHYLGTGGIFLQAEGISVLGDPFFTNPYFWNTVSPFPVRSKTKRIDHIVGTLPGLAPLQAILVTHAHYDHAMDVPYIAERFAPVCIYGSETLGNSLGALARGRFCSLAGKVNGDASDATWVRISPHMKIAAIQAEHFEHARLLGRTFFYADGEHDEPLADPPSRLFSWRVGATYSYLIDILDGGRPGKTLFRILYMPSAATHPTGAPTEGLLKDGKRIDLAVLGAAQLERDTTYPGALLHALDPRAVMLVHWDNFVDDYRSKHLLNFRVDPAEIARRIRDADRDGDVEVYWPHRGASVNFPLASTTMNII
ncbi:MAG: MBL fold metallo-hydrolase, partial [Pseudomonadota bacterium]|nr:MBL fold metallo-hydrolase [Pseudomonadota bacterium]